MSQTASTIIETSEYTPLPDGWRLMKLGEVCTRISNGTSTTQNTEGKGLPVTRIETISSGKINAQKVGWIDLEVEDLERYILRAGDILFSHINSVERLGNCALYDGTPSTLVHGMNLLRLEINKELVEPFYLLSFFKSEQARKFYDVNARRAIGQASLNTKDLSELEIPLPPLSEQKRISVILKEQMAGVEQARAAAEAQLKTAKDLPAAYLRAVFDSAEAKGWQVVKVGDISSLIIDGPHITPMYVPKGVPFVTVRNIVNRRVDLSQVSYITETDHAEFTRRGKAEKGDILYTKDGTLGIPCVVDIDNEFSFFVSVALIKLIRERADSRFVAYALESPLVLKQVELLGAGAGLKHMVLRSIRALEIPLPPMPEQRKIAAALSEQMLNAEKAKKILKDQLDSINKLPAALLRQAFTGKL